MNIIKAKLRPVARKITELRSYLLTRSLIESNEQRGERKSLKERLTEIVPDLTYQYSTHTTNMNNTYLVEKVRCQHTFQIMMALKAIRLLIEYQKKKEVTIVDIGDSSGTHIQYLNGITKDLDIALKTLSVNLDPVAIDRIQAKGLPALLCKANELSKHNINGDIFLSFEMIEHLIDPISFLQSISTNTECYFFVVTVPYVRKSRVRLNNVRNKTNIDVLAGSDHVFELSPEDWDPIFQFSGWKKLYSECYTQYPHKGLLQIMKYEWRRCDFDGFYGVILKRDHSIMNRYKVWF